MRDRYAGDVSDVLKFAFLRAVTGQTGRPVSRGIPHREMTDDQMDDISIAVLEQAAIWPKRTLFHREPMPLRVEQSARGARMRSALDGANTGVLPPLASTPK